MNDNRQVLMLTLLLLCSLALLIGYPTIKLLNIVKNKEQIESNMNKIVSELNNYYNSNTNFDDEYKLFTIKDYKITEDGLQLNSNLPENGYIYINKEGKTKIIANEETWCAFKDFNDEHVTLSSCEDLNTVKLADHIIELTYNGDGLYSSYNNNYYFRGENPNNYILINEEMYRIIKIDPDKNIKIIKNDYIENIKWSKNNKVSDYAIFDNNNIAYYLNYDNEFKKYRINPYFVETEYYSYIINTQQYMKSTSIVSMLNVEDYINVSLDTNCKNNFLNNKFCSNKNWLHTDYPYFTRDYDSQGIYAISKDGVVYNHTFDIENNVRLVFTLNKNINLDGDGTFENPYKIVRK